MDRSLGVQDSRDYTDRTLYQISRWEKAGRGTRKSFMEVVIYCINVWIFQRIRIITRVPVLKRHEDRAALDVLTHYSMIKANM